jgi:uncharacterized protein YmfQ (DUF2313 family)
MSRGTEDCLAELLALLPPGHGLPRTAESNTGRFLRPIAAELALVEADWERLLGQVTPANATDLLADYERVLGPDPCRRDTALLTVAERQVLADLRWTANGDPTPAEFVALAARLGIAVVVQTFTPPSCGVAECGADECAEADQAYGWTIHAAPAAIHEAECGATECGETLGRIDVPDIECTLRQWVPQHTLCVFVYDL